MIERMEYREVSVWQTTLFFLAGILVLGVVIVSTINLDFSEVYGTLAKNTNLE